MIIRGKVIKGDKRGAKQGFPTANLNRRLAKNKLIRGVYACLVKITDKFYKGVLIYGAPDKNKKPKLEVFLPEKRLNLYHKLIAVKIITKIRPLKNFKSKIEFLKQAKKDVAKAKSILKPLKKF